jgi:hypothetical protein
MIWLTLLFTLFSIPNPDTLPGSFPGLNGPRVPVSRPVVQRCNIRVGCQ